MYNVENLDPVYKFLPYCLMLDETGNGKGKKQKYSYSYARTYPPYPWKLNDGIDHSKEDPKKFIDICAQAGLVKWETGEERDARIKSSSEGSSGYMPYREFLRDQELIKRMPGGND